MCVGVLPVLLFVPHMYRCTYAHLACLCIYIFVLDLSVAMLDSNRCRGAGIWCVSSSGLRIHIHVIRVPMDTAAMVLQCWVALLIGCRRCLGE